jgi:glycosyltransferase involved in cell wall biosynthesis
VEKYVEECIRSVQNQTLEDIEMICVDNCSTDGSLEIVEQIAKSESRIKIYRNEKNMGVSVSRNRGMQYATGEYIYFLDSDDMIVPNALEMIYRRAVQQDLDILYFESKKIFETNEIREPQEQHRIYISEPIKGMELYSRFFRGGEWFVAVWQQLYKRSFLQDNKLLFYEGILHEDNLFSFEAAMHASRVCCEPYQVHIYRKRENSLTTADNLKFDSLTSSAYIYHKYRQYMQQYRSCDIYPDIKQMTENMVHKIIRLFQQIDSIDSVRPDQAYEMETVIMLTIGLKLYGGFFPYKLSTAVMKKIREADHVIIYGAGKVGKGLLELLTERNVLVDCFAVTAPQQEKECMGYPIYEIASLKEYRDNAIILVAAKKDAEQMRETAEQNGFANIIVTLE